MIGFITYLSTIQVILRQIIVFLFRKWHRLNTFQNTNALNEHLENALLRLGAEFTISQCDMDSRLEGIVEGLNTVGGQEKNTLEVFQQTQENRDKGISVDVLNSTLLKEDVCFV